MSKVPAQLSIRRHDDFAKKRFNYQGCFTLYSKPVTVDFDTISFGESNTKEVVFDSIKLNIKNQLYGNLDEVFFEVRSNSDSSAALAKVNEYLLELRSKRDEMVQQWNTSF